MEGVEFDKAEDRLKRELEFHNVRFTENTERLQSKYYFALAEGEQRFRERTLELARGKNVLEYGCSVGRNSLDLARSAASIVGIDISDVAIARANADARVLGLTNANFYAMDAESMDFPDSSFDFIFGSGIIHHLDVEKCMRELRRVLRPNGKALFWEPLGHNPIINVYRALTPSARTPDEHPLLREHFQIVQSHFPNIHVEYLGLLSLMAVPFRRSAIGILTRTALSYLDSAIFALGPLKWMAWYVIMELGGSSA